MKWNLNSLCVVFCSILISDTPSLKGPCWLASYFGGQWLCFSISSRP